MRPSKLPIRAALALAGIMILAVTCRKDETRLPPVIDLRVEPAQGATTDTFRFDASRTVSQSSNTKLYFQWDYGTEGSWSTLPSRSALQQFRFMKPGIYRLRVKAVTSRGGIDSTEVEIPVVQGFSKPGAAFAVSHDTANILTEVRFDASLTHDDEDSLATLQFRWDFETDGIWDTPFTASPHGIYRYPEVGKYTATLMVRDPSGLVGYAKRTVVVNLRDPDLVVDFSWLPERATAGDTILFDATATHHPAYPDMQLTYRWKFEEGDNWTEELTEPTVRHRFRSIQSTRVILRVSEQRGLFNEAVKRIHLDPANRPPVAGFQVSIPYGNIQTLFLFSGWLSSDPEDLSSSLEVRWDFEGDGNWDTEFSTEKIVYHRFTVPGSFKTTIQVRDSKGLTDKSSQLITVSPWLNETGMIMDTRDGQLYGTVKIGNQWWFAENLKYEVTLKQLEEDDTTIWKPWKVWLDFEEQSKWKEPFGRFYHIGAAMENKEQGEPDNPDYQYALCPRGWHVATRADMEELADYLGRDRMAERLEIGGDTDFNLQYLGYVDWTITWLNMFTPLDTIYTYKETYEQGYLYSYEQHTFEQRIDTWAMRFTRHTHAWWEGWAPTKYFVPVRCVKDR